MPNTGGRGEGGDVRLALTNGAVLAGGSIGENLLRVAYLVILARFLEVSELGLWTYGIAAYGLALGLVGLGFDSLIAIRLGQRRGGETEFITMTLILRVGIICIAGLSLAVYGALAEPSDAGRAVLLAFLPALLGRGIALWVRFCFLGYERLRSFIPVSLGLRVVELGFGSLLLTQGAGLLSVVALHGILLIVEAGIGLFLVTRLLTPLHFGFSLADARSFVRQSAVLGGSAAFVVWLTLGPLLVLRQLGLAFDVIGQVGLVLGMTNVLAAAGQSFVSAGLPAVSRKASMGGGVPMGYGWSILALAIAGACVLGGLGDWLGVAVVTLVFGVEYRMAGELLGLGLFAGGLILAPAGFAQVLLLRDKRWNVVLANMVAALVLPAAMLLLIGPYSGHGALIAVGIAWSVRCMVMVILATRGVTRLGGSG